MRFILLLTLLGCFEQSAFGQQAAPPQEKSTSVTLSAPLAMPLIGLLNSLPQRPSLDDSLARLAYARNQVKAVAVVRLRPTGGAPDTLDYTELDRAGYPVLTAKPDFKQRTHLRYNKRHQLIGNTQDATPGFPLVVQTIYDPATQTTTTRVGPTLASLALYQTGHAIQRGQANDYETFLMAVPDLPAPTVSHIALNRKVLSGDTTRTDVLGYQGEQVVQAEAYYAIGRAPRQRESGTVVLPVAGRTTRALEGKYIPNQRNTYDAAGRLIRTQYLPPPPLLADKPVTQTSSDGSGSMTISQPKDTLTSIYLRNADGQLLREEFKRMHYPPGFPQPTSPPFTAYDYLPNGLRHSKTDSYGTRYEYHYTFY